MKIEYLAESGDDLYDQILRLFDFTDDECFLFSKNILEVVINNKQELNLTKLDFVEPINCQLIFRLSNNKKGLYLLTDETFVCEMNLSHYKNLIFMVENSVNTNGHYWIDGEVTSDICLLFSMSGRW